MIVRTNIKLSRLPQFIGCDKRLFFNAVNRLYKIPASKILSGDALLAAYSLQKN